MRARRRGRGCPTGWPDNTRVSPLLSVICGQQRAGRMRPNPSPSIVASTGTLRPSRYTLNLLLASRFLAVQDAKEPLLYRTFRRPEYARGAHLAARSGLTS